MSWESFLSGLPAKNSKSGPQRTFASAPKQKQRASARMLFGSMIIPLNKPCGAAYAGLYRAAKLTSRLRARFASISLGFMIRVRSWRTVGHSRYFFTKTLLKYSQFFGYFLVYFS